MLSRYNFGKTKQEMALADMLNRAGDASLTKNVVRRIQQFRTHLNCIEITDDSADTNQWLYNALRYGVLTDLTHPLYPNGIGSYVIGVKILDLRRKFKIRD